MPRSCYCFFQIIWIVTERRNAGSKSLNIHDSFWRFFRSSQWRRLDREKCPNAELFLVRIFLYSDWIRTRNNSVFGHFSRSEIYSYHCWTLTDLHNCHLTKIFSIEAMSSWSRFDVFIASRNINPARSCGFRANLYNKTGR